jgi:predicted nucleic acid-binding protein
VTPADRGVLDASVAVKCFLDEEGSAAARRAVLARPDWISPDLIFLEVASVALKTVRRGLLEPALAARMVAGVGGLLVEAVPSVELYKAAFRLAADQGFSAYDAAYIALAKARDIQLVTADLKLARLAEAAGLGGLVRALDQD